MFRVNSVQFNSRLLYASNSEDSHFLIDAWFLCFSVTLSAKNIKNQAQCLHSFFWGFIIFDFGEQVPYMLLTKPPKIEGASIGEKKRHQRKLSGGEELLKCFLHVHESCIQANMGATPRRYIAFLNTYQTVYSNKKAGVEKRQHHLQVSSGE